MMKEKRFIPNLNTAQQMILCLVAPLLFASSHSVQDDDRIVFYINDHPMAFTEGVSMAQIAKSEGEMKYSVRPDLRQAIPARGTRIRMSLVRDNRALYQILDNNIRATETLKMSKIFNHARVGDAAVIELIGLKGIPKIVTFRFTE